MPDPSPPAPLTYLVSYTRADRAWAEWIAWQIEDGGDRTILDVWDFRPGTNFAEKMDRATRDADRTIAVLSPHYLDARFTAPEWNAAFARDPRGEQGILVPVRVVPCNVEGLLGQIVYIDLTGIDEARAREALRTGLVRGRVKPKVPPPFPGTPTFTLDPESVMVPLGAEVVVTTRSLTRFDEANVGPGPAFPEPAKTLWMVPKPDRRFTGRDEVLEAINRALGEHRRVALVGMGGVGKTQTAVEFAHRHRGDYQFGLWANAATPETLSADFGRIARALGLRVSDDDPAVAVASLMVWLAEEPGCLLILDNADDLDQVAPLIPAQTAGHLLLTTRFRPTRHLADAEPIDLDPMAESEGARLLLVRAGRLSPGDPFDLARPDDRDAALALAREVRGLPLALDQAGAYIEAESVSPAEYLDLYRADRHALHAHRGLALEGDHDSVAVTFRVALDRLEARDPAAAELLRFCSFLAPDAIPEELLTKGAAHLGDRLGPVASDPSPLRLRATIGIACRLSLLGRDESKRTLAMHRLVQSVVQDTLSPEERARWLDGVLLALAASFPPARDAHSLSCDRLLPHALALAVPLLERSAESLSFAKLCVCLDIALDARADYERAEDFSRHALAIYESACGRDHPDTANSLSNLAALLWSRGRLEEAEPLDRRALAIYESKMGRDHPATATSLNNLAYLLVSLGRLEEAEPLHRRALDIRESALGHDHPDTANSLSNLANLLVSRGRLEEAEPLHRRALDIRESELVPDHPDTATSLNNLAGLLVSRGRPEEAEPLYRRALAIRERVLGADHPETATSLNNLAHLLWDRMDLSGAEPLFERALTIFTSKLGADHPHSRAVRGRLDTLHFQMTTRIGDGT